jgi:enoyl-CoA hydratase/carnithine racemase
MFVEYEKNGSVVTVRLNRPDRMNSLSQALVAELDNAWRAFVADEDARIAIYTGNGRAFCAGMDVKEASERPSDDVTFPEPPLTIFHAGNVPKPVIAAVNGYAIGGGFFDVLRCDLRIAAETAVFQLAEVQRSVLPSPLIEGIAGGVPDCLVTELGLGGRIDAARACSMGLVNRVVPDEQLMAEAMSLAADIAALPPIAVRLVLEGLRLARAGRSGLLDLPAWQAGAVRELRASDDFQEALLSFLEKRPPVYRGR